MKVDEAAFRRGYLGVLSQQGVTPDDFHQMAKSSSIFELETDLGELLGNAGHAAAKVFGDWLPAAAVGTGVVGGVGGGALYHHLTDRDKNVETVESLKKKEKMRALKQAIMQIQRQQGKSGLK